MTVYNSSGDSDGTSFGQSGEKISFYGETPVVKATVSGSAGANAALISLLTALEDLGLIVDSSS